MNDHVHTSCWGVTAKAVVALAGITLLVWLAGGMDSAVVAEADAASKVAFAAD